MLRQRAYPGAGANVDQFCKTVEGFPRNYLVIDTVGTNPLQAEERLALHWIAQTIDLQHILFFQPFRFGHAGSAQRPKAESLVE